MSISSLQTFFSRQLNKNIKEIETIGGGCINQTYKIKTVDDTFFCKINSASKFPHLFEKERNGLELIQSQHIIKTPAVINYSVKNDDQILVMEWIEEGNRNNKFWKTFGEELAALHQIHSEYFGLNEDNFMGSVPQSNFQHGEWFSFFMSQRLQPLVKMCKQLLPTKLLKQFENLYQRLRQIFNNEKPSLLHGDLWTGNFMCTNESKPVLIDPAVYFGHRSVDMGMTTLFGGFDPLFYESYNYLFPFPANYKEQWMVCNLYPLLIHLFLFWKSYLSQIEQTLKRFA